jgi:hypothetical protein
VSPGAALGAMTLGQLITALRRLPPDALVWLGSGRYMPTTLSSYHGYYEDLALGFEVGLPRNAALLLSEMERALGQTFVGYKGGSYRASEDTAVWVSANQHEAYGNAVVAVEERPGGYELVVERIDS